MKGRLVSRGLSCALALVVLGGSAVTARADSKSFIDKYLRTPAVMQKMRAAQEKLARAKSAVQSAWQGAKNALSCTKKTREVCSRKLSCTRVRGCATMFGRQFCGCVTIFGKQYCAAWKPKCSWVKSCQTEQYCDYEIKTKLTGAKDRAQKALRDAQAKLRETRAALRREAQRRYERAKEVTTTAAHQSLGKLRGAIRTAKELTVAAKKALERKARAAARRLVDGIAAKLDVPRTINKALAAAFKFATEKAAKAVRAKFDQAIRKAGRRLRRALIGMVSRYGKGMSVKRLRRLTKGLSTSGRFSSKLVWGGSLAAATFSLATVASSHGVAAVACSKKYRVSNEAYRTCYAKVFNKSAKYAVFDTLVATAYGPIEHAVVIPLTVQLTAAVTAALAAATAGVGAVAGFIVGYAAKTAASYLVFRVAQRFFPQYERTLWTKFEGPLRRHALYAADKWLSFKSSRGKTLGSLRK